ncbi:hypothetical protein LINPERPRIM_LOCUS39359 [Linum perenne]
MSVKTVFSIWRFEILPLASTLPMLLLGVISTAEEHDRKARAGIDYDEPSFIWKDRGSKAAGAHGEMICLVQGYLNTRTDCSATNNSSKIRLHSAARKSISSI